MSGKNKQLIQLKKLFHQSKEKYGITESFSYRFDYRTKKLILSYSIPTKVTEFGVVKTRMRKVEKYRKDIDIHNFKRFFKGSTSIVIDDAEFVRNQIEINEEKSNVGDEHDFKWWIESFLSRSFGQTKTIKPLSESTITQNKHHLSTYYDWVTDKFKKSESMVSHIDDARKWFEQYYQHMFESGRWNPSTIGIAHRNVRGFYNYVADRYDPFPHDILRSLKIPKAQNKRDAINPYEYEQILDFIVQNRDDALWGKFILLLRLQLKTGMRVGELVSIRNRSIDLNNKQILITGKGDRSRYLNFNQSADEDIWNSITEKMSKSLFLFYRTRVEYFPKEDKLVEIDIDLTKHTTESYYQKRFRIMRETLGIRGKGVITSHSLRRYFITRYVQETSNRDLCRQIVGHSSTRMTDYYVSNMIQPDTRTTIDIGV